MKKNKFRAWHKEKKCWISLHNNGYSFNPNNGQIYYEGLNITSRIDLMQYTGLKDKNGKEIYEGDIVRVNKLTFENAGPLPENLVVKFYSGMFQLFRDDEYLYGLHLMYIEDGEVIGNIYEHPELLKN
ncbi:hypothetical protein COF09_28780 [Bacillus toyonensis]|uniref:YopX family protein n=1 Tax=Bacillus toyonensis TaxID=155322 RepID=UPI000BFE4CBC|nr:YopX family protein [Bacillus toyonensis]PHC36759.1 hypothetical protein COF09_28780 [Bacillus toyonensis]